MAKSKSAKKSPLVIGTTDHIDFPDFEFENIGCKVDTGATTSALHCHKVRMIEKDGIQFVRFQLLDPKHPSFQKSTFELPLHNEREVRNSFGQTELRYSIKTRIKLFDQHYNVEFTLADRAKMRFPVLLGSRFLKNKFIVDVSMKDLSFQNKKQKESHL
jgi:hypothetical protein